MKHRELLLDARLSLISTRSPFGPALAVAVWLLMRPSVAYASDMSRLMPYFLAVVAGVLIFVLGVTWLVSKISRNALFRAALWTASSLLLVAMATQVDASPEPRPEEERVFVARLLMLAPLVFAGWLTSIGTVRGTIAVAHRWLIAGAVVLGLGGFSLIWTPAKKAAYDKQRASMETYYAGSALTAAFRDQGVSRHRLWARCEEEPTLPKLAEESPLNTHCFKTDAEFGVIREDIVAAMRSNGWQLALERDAGADRKLLVFCHSKFSQDFDAPEGGMLRRTYAIKMEVLIPTQSAHIGKYWGWATANGAMPAGQSADVSCASP